MVHICLGSSARLAVFFLIIYDLDFSNVMLSVEPRSCMGNINHSAANNNARKASNSCGLIYSSPR